MGLIMDDWFVKKKVLIKFLERKSTVDFGIVFKSRYELDSNPIYQTSALNYLNSDPQHC